MASHIPIPVTKEIGDILRQYSTMDFSEAKPFEKVRVDNGFYQLLTDEYNMDEYHGQKDSVIFAFTPKHLMFIYEFHLDDKGFINQVYKVE